MTEWNLEKIDPHEVSYRLKKLREILETIRNLEGQLLGYWQNEGSHTGLFEQEWEQRPLQVPEYWKNYDMNHENELKEEIRFQIDVMNELLKLKPEVFSEPCEEERNAPVLYYRRRCFPVERYHPLCEHLDIPAWEPNVPEGEEPVYVIEHRPWQRAICDGCGSRGRFNDLLPVSHRVDVFKGGELKLTLMPEWYCCSGCRESSSYCWWNFTLDERCPQPQYKRYEYYGDPASCEWWVTDRLEGLTREHKLHIVKVY